MPGPEAAAHSAAAPRGAGRAGLCLPPAGRQRPRGQPGWGTPAWRAVRALQQQPLPAACPGARESEKRGSRSPDCHTAALPATDNGTQGPAPRGCHRVQGNHSAERHGVQHSDLCDVAPNRSKFTIEQDFSGRLRPPSPPWPSRIEAVLRFQHFKSVFFTSSSRTS